MKYCDVEVFVLEEKKTIFPTLEENVAYMNEVLPVKESFDLVQREIIIGERKCTFYFIDGFTKDESLQKMITGFFAIKRMICQARQQDLQNFRCPMLKWMLLAILI